MSDHFPHATPACDAAVIEVLHDLGGSALIDELVTLFLGYAPVRLATARAGLASGDAARIGVALHSLNGSCAQLGANAMRELCQRGEAAAAAGSMGTLGPLLDALDEAWAAYRQWIGAWTASTMLSR